MHWIVSASRSRRASTSPHPLPAAYHRALDAGLQEIGVELGGAQRSAIDGHVRLLLAWNQVDQSDGDSRSGGRCDRARHRQPHRAPRAARTWAPALRRPGQRWRVPGLPVAAALPADGALLVDSIAKKVRFLDAAAAAVGMAGTIATFTGRAEHLAARRRAPRALAGGPGACRRRPARARRAGVPPAGSRRRARRVEASRPLLPK